MKYNFLRFPHGKSKAVTLSYDDGAYTDMKLLELLNKYNLKCTFNIAGIALENDIGLTKDFIKKEILENGHEIANHGYNHRAQDVIRPVEGIKDILDSRLTLEKEFGIIVRGFAFPDRSVNRFSKPGIYADVRNRLKALDIAYARIAEGDNDSFELPDDWYNWAPTAHHGNPDVMKYIDKFIKLKVDDLYIASRSPKIFYLWGHSFEFENNGNWDLFKEICEKLSGKDDIWYATNIEIYEYVNAYNSLIYSADSNLIYNPTLYKIWFDIDGKLYSIKSGETLKIV